MGWSNPDQAGSQFKDASGGPAGDQFFGKFDKQAFVLKPTITAI